MSNYDEYFVNDDKPFAENLNDALLLSNVFDMSVSIEAPKMFSNSTWVNSTSRRKCGVAVIRLIESLPSNVSISTVDDNSVLTGTGTVKLGFYPNFNSFGKIKSIDWEGTGVVINLKTITNEVIVNNISKGNIENQSSHLRTLEEIMVEVVLNSGQLTSLTIVMENKQQERYGATVGITNVTGLDERLSNMEDTIGDIDNTLDTIETTIENIENTDWTYLYASNDNPQCEIKAYVRELNGFLEIYGIFNRQGSTSTTHILELELPNEFRFTPPTSSYYLPIISANTGERLGSCNGNRLRITYLGNMVTQNFYILCGLK